MDSVRYEPVTTVGRRALFMTSSTSIPITSIHIVCPEMSYKGRKYRFTLSLRERDRHWNKSPGLIDN